MNVDQGQVLHLVISTIILLVLAANRRQRLRIEWRPPNSGEGQQVSPAELSVEDLEELGYQITLI